MTISKSGDDANQNFHEAVRVGLADLEEGRFQNVDLQELEKYVNSLTVQTNSNAEIWDLSVPESDLFFDSHLKKYKLNFNDDAHDEKYWYKQAQIDHILIVISALHCLQASVIKCVEIINSDAAKNYLLYGVARRSRLIWSALRQIYNIASPSRVNSLTVDEVFELERALNDVYIHAKGATDSFAWAIYHLLGDSDLKRLSPVEIGLFSKKFLKNLSVADFAPIVKVYKDWDQDLKTRRDPIAHRMPLTVPPSFLNEDDVIIYKKLQEKEEKVWKELLEESKLSISEVKFQSLSDVIESLQNQRQSLGTFYPFIVHDPDAPKVPIHPTVAADEGILVSLLHRLTLHLNNRISEGGPAVRSNER